MAGLNASELKPRAALNDGLSVFPVEEHEAQSNRTADRIVFVLIDVDEYVTSPVDRAPEPQQFDWRLAFSDMRHKLTTDGRRGALLAAIAIGSAAVTISGVRFYFATPQIDTSLRMVEQTETATPPVILPDIPSKAATEDAPPEVLTVATPEPSAPPIAAKARASAAPAPTTFHGHLTVDSVPQGASVFINQQQVGITPLDLPRQPAGSYAVWVQREGFQRWTAGVLVPASKTTRITAKLESSR